MTTLDLLNEVIELASGYPAGYGGRLPILLDDAKYMERARADAASDDPRRQEAARNITLSLIGEARSWTATFAPEKFRRLGEIKKALAA